MSFLSTCVNFVQDKAGITGNMMPGAAKQAGLQEAVMNIPSIFLTYLFASYFHTKSEEDIFSFIRFCRFDYRQEVVCCRQTN